MLGSTLSLNACSSVAGVEEIERGSPTSSPLPDGTRRRHGSIARGIDDGALAVQEAPSSCTPAQPAEVDHSLLSGGADLAEQPDLQEHSDNPHPAFVEEALRLESPFRYLMRSVPSDTSLAGQEIPAGAVVLLFWGAASRDRANATIPTTWTSTAGDAQSRRVRSWHSSLRGCAPRPARGGGRTPRAARAHEQHHLTPNKHLDGSTVSSFDATNSSGPTRRG